MGDPYKDGWSKFDAKGLEKLQDDLFKVASPLRKLAAKAPVDQRWKALEKAASVAAIDKMSSALDKRGPLAQGLTGISDPTFPAAVSKALTLIVDTAKAEVKAVGKGGPFPKTQAMIDAAIATSRSEAKLLPAGREEARKVWSALSNESRNDATFIEGHAEDLRKFADTLAKDAAKVAKGPPVDKHLKAITTLKKTASALITDMDSAAKYVEKAVDDYDAMEGGLLESADDMAKPQFLADLIKGI